MSVIKLAEKLQTKYITAQMGAGIRVKFRHPQYFAKFAEYLFQNNQIDKPISVEIYSDRVVFFDGSGSRDGQQMREIAEEKCAMVEATLHLNHGELFNYSDMEHA
jgi:hypothetical protein